MSSLAKPCVLAAAVLAGTAGPAHAARYTFTDLGTLGGPNDSVGNMPYLNAAGVVTGTSDTAAADPFGAAESGAFNGDPFVQHTILFRDGELRDLGALGSDPGADSSYANAINGRGDVAGLSDDGAINPATGLEAVHAVLWRDGRAADLGTLGGSESQAFSLNDRDQVTGVAGNRIPDPLSMLGWGGQTRAFLWERGRMRDLGTLGGPDSFGWFVNDAGQVAGVSYTSDRPGPVTGVPPAHAFLWQHGRMRDLGSLGGSVPTFGGVTALNDRGQVVGQSDLAGDVLAHAYEWDGARMRDLGTLGGPTSSAGAVNAGGDVAGVSDLADGTHHGFRWARGVMHDLAPLPGSACSTASAIDDRGDVAGSASGCHGHSLAVLWRHDAPVDLNTLVDAAPLRLASVEALDDAGDIVGDAILPDGDKHLFLLSPKGR